MKDIIREAFETVCFPNFGLLNSGLERDHQGIYYNHTVEDHWQTFQEGWDSAIEYLKNKESVGYKDTISNGGYDPRPEYDDPNAGFGLYDPRPEYSQRPEYDPNEGFGI